jgi:hypothetical protein
VVNILLTHRQENFFSSQAFEKRVRRRCARGFRRLLRLFVVARCVELSLPNNQLFLFDTVPSAPVHRFEESIGGRPYLIEVAAVSDDRWRAYIVRLPGVPTALMPFYGATPVEAAHQLCEWLARAHARSANPAGSV